ncbi:MAG TPA: DUF1540 domain-containing protein [Candidatus Onthousia faecigallinarum]|nr:DUF1540 domain-containing protein [Candidatus Onthousia faecigallinarum]
MNKRQSIKCDVESCKYQNENLGACSLEEIKVSSNCGCPSNDVSDCEETVCSSFESIEKEKKSC